MQLNEATPPGPAVWSTTVKIHSYDVDVSRSATLQSLCRYFLDGAWTHAEALGVGFSKLAQQNRVWVLSRMLIQVQRRPFWGEDVVFSTWPRGTDSLFALRDFEFVDKAGSTLAGGTSAWLVLNRTNRRPQKIIDLVRHIPVTAKRATNREPKKLPGQPPDSKETPCTAKPSDIDVNAHVNSARYLDWLLDTFSLEFQTAKFVYELEINYLGETLAGDHVTVLSNESAPGQWHQSVVKSTGTEVCRAFSQWVPCISQS